MCYIYCYAKELNSNSLCRRLELKDLLPTIMQRLTKYPLLIENLLKYSQRKQQQSVLDLQCIYSCLELEGKDKQ